MQTKELYSSRFIRLVGGGGGGDLDPEIRGNPVSNILFCPSGSQFGLKISGSWGGKGRAGPQGPSPGSATALCEALRGLSISPKFKQH